MSKFKELFEMYGYIVEPFEDSYIADNGVFCIPFTEFESANLPVISAVSFLSCDKEDIKNYYTGENHIGCKIFRDFANNNLKFHHFGCICNHDHTLSEIEFCIKNNSNKIYGAWYIIHKEELIMKEKEEIIVKNIDIITKKNESISLLESYLYSIIIALYEDSITLYMGIDDEKFIEYVCKRIGISEEDYKNLINNNNEKCSWNN